MVTVLLILAFVALLLTLWSFTKDKPLWPAVFVLCLIELLRQIPLGKVG